MRFQCVLLLLAVPAWTDRCAPPPELASFVQQLPTDPKARRTAITAALNAKPDDFTLNRLLLDMSVYHRRTMRERYRRAWEARPASIDSTYLYARSLVGSSTPEALNLYVQILEKDPDYPWVHLSQLEIYRAEVFRDRRKLQSSYERLRRVCPSLWKPYEYLTEIEDPAVLVREASRLRDSLAASNDPRTFRFYPSLWAAEFRLRPKEQHDAERRIVAEDLKRLRSFDSVPEVQSAIGAGARLTGDDALAHEIAARRPPSPYDRYRDWSDAHPYPKPGDPPAQKRAYAQARLEASAKWIELAPDEPLGYAERFHALVALDAPAADLGRAGDDLLAADRRRDFVPLAYFLTVARTYMDRGVLPDRVPAILDEALKSFDDPESVIEIDLHRGTEMTVRNRMQNVAWHAEAVGLLSEWNEKQGQPVKARELLRSLEAYLAAKAPPASGQAQPGYGMEYREAQFSYWRRVATLAEREGRKLDALHAYREAFAVSRNKDEAMLAPQRRLWKELGGSDEAWVQWIGTIPQAGRQPPPERVEFTPVNRPLPEFSVKDASGGTWTPARLEGKTTIAVVWATWCLPCRDELPYLVKLAERLKDRADVQVISINTDENVGSVEPFLKQNAYTFPVVLAKYLADDLMPSFAIPRTWIIRDGVLAMESVGFSGDGEKWVNDVIARLEAR